MLLINFDFITTQISKNKLVKYFDVYLIQNRCLINKCGITDSR